MTYFNYWCKYTRLTFKAVSLAILFFLLDLYTNADSIAAGSKDSALINEYIKAKGYVHAIIFDASNAKQFWVDKSVSCKDGKIIVSLNDNQSKHIKESIPLKIQLENVLETMDCRIDVITENASVNFSVTNKDSTALSVSTTEDDFIQNHIIASRFHLEDTKDFSFNIVVSSEDKDFVSIEKVVLSFSENKESKYYGSPGFNVLSQKIEEEGVSVPNSEIKYIVLKEHNKIFIRIPNELTTAHPFFYHTCPVDKKDYAPNREQYGYNNMDFKITSSGVVVPKTYSSTSKYTIIQRQLPAYKYSWVQIGQSENGKKMWTILLKNP